MLLLQCCFCNAASAMLLLQCCFCNAAMLLRLGRFSGEWSQGKRHGQGTYREANGDSCVRSSSSALRVRCMRARGRVILICLLLLLPPLLQLLLLLLLPLLLSPLLLLLPLLFLVRLSPSSLLSCC